MGTSLSEKYIFYGKDRTVTRGVFSTWSLIPGMGPRGQCCGANLTPWPSQIYERLSCSPWLRNLKAMALEKWKERLWADASMDYLDCRSTVEKEKELSKSSFQGIWTLALLLSTNCGKNNSLYWWTLLCHLLITFSVDLWIQIRITEWYPEWLSLLSGKNELRVGVCPLCEGLVAPHADWQPCSLTVTAAPPPARLFSTSCTTNWPAPMQQQWVAAM